MVLKRKRSDSEISTTSSLFNSSPLSSGNMMSMDFHTSQQIPTPSLFSSRTRKRYRDNRPTESDIHQHTLSLLFSAQQSTQSQSQPLHLFRQQAPVSSLPTLAESKPQQASLHSFWAIPNARQLSPASTYSTSSFSSTPTGSDNMMTQILETSNCEDCDASLNAEEDSMDVDMIDIDVSANGGNHACSSCGKQVCRNCAVSNLGAERKCLGCAGRRKWVGGVGWVAR
ncbi:hypothetical protein B0O99DRAFT_355245 [Bisporella sp. PMI_857]|nr:hypothetical protein B0O99DRAFT_355245 [Bisporella sp. PMI_857]